MDILARLCHGDIAMRRGFCKIKKDRGDYVMALPSVVVSKRAVSVSDESGSSHSSGSGSGSSVASRGRRAC